MSPRQCCNIGLQHFSWCAQHGQQLGGASPLWRLMAPTTSQWQLRRREAGWEGSRRRSRDSRNTWCGEAVRALSCCAYKAGRSGRASQTWRSPMSIKGLSRRRGGCAMKVAGLTWGDLYGCPRCPVRMGRGVVRDGGAREGLLAVEKSAEVIRPAGIIIVGKGRTRSRATGRSCSWESH